ncbi:hypothetical protein RCL1_005813 [Eukaryota sp. TZLM3-RCL]
MGFQGSLNPSVFSHLKAVAGGSQAVCYRATKFDTGQDCLIKKPSLSYFSADKHYAQEQRAAGCLFIENCPFIVNYIGLLEHNGEPYMVTEYHPLSLFTALKNSTTFSEQIRWKFFLQILYAVLCLHDNNLIHRDLKPANIMLDNTNLELANIKIIDFGCCLFLDQQLETSPPPHTIEYSPPGFMKKPHLWRCRSSDYYAIGLMALEMWGLNVQKSLEKSLNQLRALHPVFADVVSRFICLNERERLSGVDEFVHSIQYKNLLSTWVFPRQPRKQSNLIDQSSSTPSLIPQLMTLSVHTPGQSEPNFDSNFSLTLRETIPLFRPLQNFQPNYIVENIYGNFSGFQFLATILQNSRRFLVLFRYSESINCLGLNLDISENAIISCGCQHFIIMDNNLVYFFGKNSFGQIGQIIPNFCESSIYIFECNHLIKNISCGNFYSIFHTNFGFYQCGGQPRGYVVTAAKLSEATLAELAKPVSINLPFSSNSNVFMTSGSNHTLFLVNSELYFYSGFRVKTTESTLKAKKYCLDVPTQLPFYPVFSVISNENYFIYDDGDKRFLSDFQGIKSELESVKSVPQFFCYYNSILFYISENRLCHTEGPSFDGSRKVKGSRFTSAVFQKNEALNSCLIVTIFDGKFMFWNGKKLAGPQVRFY